MASGSRTNHKYRRRASSAAYGAAGAHPKSLSLPASERIQRGSGSKLRVKREIVGRYIERLQIECKSEYRRILKYYTSAARGARTRGSERKSLSQRVNGVWGSEWRRLATRHRGGGQFNAQVWTRCCVHDLATLLLCTCCFSYPMLAFCMADFARAKALMNSEVAQILEHKREIMQGKGTQPKRYTAAVAEANRACLPLPQNLHTMHARAAAQRFPEGLPVR